MPEYSLKTYNGENLISFYTIEKTENEKYAIAFKINFEDNEDGRYVSEHTVLQSVNLYPETALTFQIRETLSTLEDENTKYLFPKAVTDNTITEKIAQDSITNAIVYVDFGNIFNGRTGKKEKDSLSPENCSKAQLTRLSALKRVELLFNEGFYVKRGDKEYHYIPFDKSASMSRNSRISFIEKDLKELLDQRLMLDMNLKEANISVNLSKLYAYRGLYMSANERVTLSDNFNLNEETVIVIKDKYVVSEEQKIITAKSHESTVKKGEGGAIFEIEEGSEKINMNAYDGQGLISTEYAEKIRSLLFGEGEDASSFQVRMPFTKGVLHKVDFHNLAKELLGVENIDKVKIRDVFDEERDLEKAKIILTESMFKCCGWLKEYIAYLKKNSPNNESTDPMKYYFRKFREYNHSLYVGNTNLNLINNGEVKFNYQFFNTLDLNETALNSIVSNHTKIIENIEGRYLDLSNADRKERAFSDTEEVKIVKESNWEAALKRNSAFLRDPKIKGMINGVKQSLIKDIGIGRIIVKGECRFLSRDLLAMVIDMLDGDGVRTEKEKSLLKEKKKEYKIPQDKFYIPKVKKGVLKNKKHYALLRNPHLSRNEQALLKPFFTKEDDIYYRYFSHLNGVIMVGEESVVPVALGGADFDGDLVKIIYDENINAAIEKYMDEPKKGKIKRKLPVISIPSQKAINVKVTDNVDFETVKNTFSNQVGYISNLAIKFAKKEYYEKNQDYKNKCAECTILTGLEIDAAKTGVHPDLRKIEEKDDHRPDYFLSLKDKIESMSMKKTFVFDKTKSGEEVTISFSGATKAYLKINTYGNEKSDNTAEVDTEGNSGIVSVDRLPYYFYKQLKDYQQPASGEDDNTAIITKKPVQNIRFKFESEDDWDKNLDSNKLIPLKNIITAYNRLQRFTGKIYRTREKYKNSKYSACVYNLLNIRYDNIGMTLYKEGENAVSVREAVNNVYSFMEQYVTDIKTGKHLMEYIVDNNWQFTEKALREDFIADVLGINKERISKEKSLCIITDFSYQGYKLFYYIVKDIMSKNEEGYISNWIDQEESTAVSDKPSSEDKKSQDSLYSDMLAIYKSAVANKESKEIWEGKIREYCTEKVQEIHELPEDEVLKYAHSLRGTVDKNGIFFWDYFDTETIIEKIAHEGKTVQKSQEDIKEQVVEKEYVG